jgi:hypothetical protein
MKSQIIVMMQGRGVGWVVRVDGLHFQYGHYQEKIKDINICNALFGVRRMRTTL